MKYIRSNDLREALIEYEKFGGAISWNHSTFNREKFEKGVLLEEHTITLEEPSTGRLVQFLLTNFPGLCGTLILYNLNGGRTLHSETHAFIRAMAHAGNYTRLMFSHVWPETLQNFKDNGYVIVDSYKNRRTDNPVEVLARDV